MKTTFIKVIVCIAVLVATAINTKAQAQDQFITNDVVTDGVVTSKVIYLNDGSLHHHMKYDFVYDNESRMTEKVAYKWNSSKERWDPYYKMSYSYTSTEIVVSYGKWNEKDKDYTKAVEKNVYELNESNMPVACLTYKWNERKNDWAMVNNVHTNDQPVLWAIM